MPPIYFSTEILFRGERLPFTDGDVLLRGDGVVLRNEDAIKLFYPAANFLGLDALDAGGPPPEEKVPHITHIGRQTVANINGGTVPVGGAGTGLAWYGSYWRPFGRYVAIHGEIPSGIDQFRVAYRKHDEARPANPATAKGIAVVSGAGWQVEEYNLLMSDCSGWAAYYSDGDGWYDAAEYRRLESGVGMPADCTSQLALTVWNSQGPGIDSEGHYRIWLQWKIGANIYEEAFDHHVQFDNKAPEILDLQIPGGACATYGPDDMPIMVRANFYDAHFLYYRLRLFGGNPPSSAWYPPVYHDTSAVDAVGPTGTGGATVDLHTVDMSVLSAGSVVTCAYGIMLWVEDSTIYGGFDPTTNQLPWATTYESWKEITFDYMPYGP